jgi:glycosyl hydrolase family 59 (putative galactocerebrosidase)
MIRWAGYGLCFLATGLALPAIALEQKSGAISVDLSVIETDAEPAGFTFWHTGEGEVGKCGIIADRTAADGRAIAQLSHDRTDYRFPLAIYKPFTGKDLEVSVRSKAVAGVVDQAAGVAVRLLTPDDYYVAGANALEDVVGFYRVVKGQYEQLGSANVKVSANAWHTLVLKAEGDHFTVSFDGKPLISVHDKTFSEPGKVALWTKADSMTYFDTISITPLG